MITVFKLDKFDKKPLVEMLKNSKRSYRATARLGRGVSRWSVPPVSHREVTPVKYVWIDFHKKMRQAVILGEDGELLNEARFMNTLEGIEEFVRILTATGGEVKAVLEPTILMVPDSSTALSRFVVSYMS